LKHGNYVARFSFPVLEVPASKPKFIERLEDDYIVRDPKPPQPQVPKIEIPSIVPKPANNGQTPPGATPKPDVAASKETSQATLPFGTGI
jgi:hypothetical protein